MPRWQFVATELNGTAVGELRNVADRRVYLGVNRVPVLSGRVRLDHPFADRLLACDVLVKAYRDGVLRFVGPVVGAEEVADEQGAASVAFNAAGPLWRIGRRLIGKTTGGYSAASQAKSLHVRDILLAVNADAYTGIDVGTTAAGVGTAATLTHAPYKNALEAVNELVSSLDGPDVEQVPLEPAAVAGGTRIATFNVLAALGQSRPAAVFEYGTGRRNVASYKRQISADGMLNAGYVLPPSSDPLAAVVTATDATSISKYGRLEALVAADVGSGDLRQKLVDEHVRVRKVPRQLITFTPTRDDPSAPGRVPQYGPDFTVGDAVPFRAVMRVEGGTHAIRVNASLRVYAVEFVIDAQGMETPTFTLTAD